jgi:hypothetical protein
VGDILGRISADELRQLYLSGLGTVEIARRIGATPTGVNGTLKRLGVPLRSRTEALKALKDSGRWQRVMLEKCDFNAFELRGDTAVLFATNRQKQHFEILIDATDLPRLQEHGRRWRVVRRQRTCYARASTGVKGDVYLHQFIVGGSSRGTPVDHKNHNGLDNRRKNLRIATRSLNNLNRAEAKRGSRSGLRGVKWSTQKGKWQARIIIDGRDRHFGYFTDKHEAAAVVQATLKRLGVVEEEVAPASPPP